MVGQQTKQTQPQRSTTHTAASTVLKTLGPLSQGDRARVLLAVCCLFEIDPGNLADDAMRSMRTEPPVQP